MKRKVIVWFKRYIPAEVAAVCGALIGGFSAHVLFYNPVVTAIGGTVGDGVFYYGTIVLRDLWEQKEKHKKITFRVFAKTIRNMLLEFGPSEFLDSFIIRPISMYIFPLLLQNIGFGLIVGKVVADIIFYIPTIISYELRMKFGKS